ncbi:hypothetical protein BU26DRAFT_570694 [Trematosphaeria pertusa]|uniref:Uncharacterized protein n=1 Tax=Trematosphaeria pertusa TaxID=390896 RepID=A0A6A6HWN9_9PLEO|nr:uncharacterized protein BU26DRAFT_570694 [Trematosphaeria pertusa]KAF2242624.1 hypothetical protein BU26DRAFT_570694 [Trematosphaeria pertusa]
MPDSISIFLIPALSGVPPTAPEILWVMRANAALRTLLGRLEATRPARANQLLGGHALADLRASIDRTLRTVEVALEELGRYRHRRPHLTEEQELRQVKAVVENLRADWAA